MKKCPKIHYSDEITGRENIDYRETPALQRAPEKEIEIAEVLVKPCDTCGFTQKCSDIFMQ